MIGPVRVQRQRVKGWRMPPNTVNVGRPSKWGNPFKVAPAFVCESISMPEITQESAVLLYREWIERALARWPSVGIELEELRGKNLACWCRLDEPCHADVLIELANRPEAAP